MGIITRGCSVGNGSDELASQRESGNVAYQVTSRGDTHYIGVDGRTETTRAITMGFEW